MNIILLTHQRELNKKQTQVLSLPTQRPVQ